MDTTANQGARFAEQHDIDDPAYLICVLTLLLLTPTFLYYINLS